MGAFAYNRISKTTGFLCALGLALVTAPCDFGPHPRAQGAGDPSRPTFVSLNPCLDAILVQTAEPAQILALSHYSRDDGLVPKGHTEQIPFVSGTAEEIIALQPDIVLASTFIAPTTHAALKRSGLRVERFDNPATVAQNIKQVRRIAGLGGSPAKATSLVQEMTATPALKDGQAPSALLWQPSQIVPGEATLIAQLLREAGFASHSAAKGLNQADYVPLETVIADPPDLLLVAGDSIGQRHPLLRDLPEMRIERLDPKLLNCGGPNIAKVRARLADIRGAMDRAGQ